MAVGVQRRRDCVPGQRVLEWNAWKLGRGYQITGPVERYQCHLPRDREWMGMPTVWPLDRVKSCWVQSEQGIGGFEMRERRKDVNDPM